MPSVLFEVPGSITRKVDLRLAEVEAEEDIVDSSGLRKLIKSLIRSLSNEREGKEGSIQYICP
jgi:hypothetical protein